jgi:hypothetical protein
METQLVHLPLTAHAQLRMTGRRIPASAVSAALLYGREVRARGAEIFVIGRREVRRAEQAGVDLRDLEGLQVVCVRSGGAVLTCYRNRDISRLRDAGCRNWRRAA